MKRYQGSSFSDGDDPAKGKKFRMQETLSLNWGRERAVMKTVFGDCHLRSRGPSSQ